MMDLRLLARKITGNNYSHLDLFLAIVIFLYIVSPRLFSDFLDLPGLFIPALVFMLLFLLRGFGLIVITFLWFLVLGRIVRSLGKWYLDDLFEYFSKMLISFIVSYGDGLLMTFVTIMVFAYVHPLIFMFVDVSDTTHILESHANEIFSMIPSFINIRDRFIFYVAGIVLTGFSYLSLFLIKQLNFSITGTEKLKKIIRNELTVKEVNK